MDISNLSVPPERPRKTALQKLQEDMERQLAPLRQIQEMQDLAKRYAPGYQIQDLMRQLEPQRQIMELLERTAIPKHIQEIIDGTSIAAQVHRMMEPYFPKNAFASLGLGSMSQEIKQYEEHLKPVFQQAWLEKLQRQAFSGLSAVDFARQLEEANPAFQAMAEAKKSLDRLWPSFRDVDFSQFVADEADNEEAKQAAASISGSVADQASLQETVDRIVAAIQAQQKPTVQLMLWLFFRKVLDWLIAGAIGAAMGHYAPALLGESPQAAKKAVEGTARLAVSSPELLLEFRYVSAKVLAVRQNPRALSPEVSRLTFGKPVKLLKKDKDFALVLWTDKESGAEVQGWVFARYLNKFN